MNRLLLLAALASSILLACDQSTEPPDRADTRLDVDGVEGDADVTEPVDTATAVDAADVVDLLDTSAADTADPDSSPLDIALMDGDDALDEDLDGAQDVEVNAGDTGDVQDGDAAPDAGDVDVALEPLPIVAPEGFEIATLGRGITVYRKDYAAGEPDWVTVVDLRIARVESVVGDWVGPPTSTVEQRAIIRHWDDAVARGPSLGGRPRVLVNGAFFSPTVDPTPLTHGLEVGGQPVSYGYGLQEYPDHNALVAWSNEAHGAAIVPWDILVFEQFPDVVGAFTSDVPRPDNNSYIGRTLVGVRDFDGAGAAEAMYFFVSSYSNVPDAVTVLESFGATATAMWSGGSSSAFVLDGVERVSPRRREPHVVAVFEPDPVGCGGCSDHATCDADARVCVCDVGWSGATCETCDGCAPDVVLVDDADAGFSTFGGTYWYSVNDHDDFVTRAWQGGVHYTIGDAGGVQVYTGRWVTPAPMTGHYRVEVYLAAPDPFDPVPPAGNFSDAWITCDSVRYIVLHDGAPAGELVTIDHHQTGWVELAEAQFTNRRGDVRSDDRTTAGCTLQFDAMRWTRLP